MSTSPTSDDHRESRKTFDVSRMDSLRMQWAHLGALAVLIFTAAGGWFTITAQIERHTSLLFDHDSRIRQQSGTLETADTRITALDRTDAVLVGRIQALEQYRVADAAVLAKLYEQIGVLNTQVGELRGELRTWMASQTTKR